MVAAWMASDVSESQVDPGRRTSIFPALALIRHWQADEMRTHMQQDLLHATEAFLEDKECKVSLHLGRGCESRTDVFL